MSKRGDYVTVSRALFRGPDFQSLPGTARWTFVCLKQSMSGAAGIDVLYHAEILARLTVETGWSAETVIADLDTLEAAGWIRREDNIVWVVGHLTYDPHARAHEPKKRIGIQRHVAALPRRPIVKAYIAQHAVWFPPAECEAEGLGWALSQSGVCEDPKGSHREVIEESSSNSTNNQVPSTKGRASGEAAPGSPVVPPPPEIAAASNWVAEGTEWWQANVGQVTLGQFGKLLKPVVDRHTWPATFAGMQECVAEKKRLGKDLTLKWFVQDAARWIEQAGMALTDECGDLTPRGKRLTGMAA